MNKIFLQITFISIAALLSSVSLASDSSDRLKIAKKKQDLEQAKSSKKSTPWLLSCFRCIDDQGGEKPENGSTISTKNGFSSTASTVDKTGSSLSSQEPQTGSSSSVGASTPPAPVLSSNPGSSINHKVAPADEERPPLSSPRQREAEEPFAR